jgi:hypothetical protein
VHDVGGRPGGAIRTGRRAAAHCPARATPTDGGRCSAARAHCCAQVPPPPSPQGGGRRRLAAMLRAVPHVAELRTCALVAFCLSWSNAPALNVSAHTMAGLNPFFLYQ